MIETILLPLDDSERSHDAIRFVSTLANVGRAHVILLEVVPDPALRPHAEAVLERATDDFTSAGMRVTHEVVGGDTVAAILQVAQDHDVDLVCMSTQRWSDVDRWLNGSVMDAVLRQTNLPLLVVPPACDAVWSQPTGPVLVALDGSPTAEQVLPAAVDVAALLGAPICLIRVDRDRAAAAAYLADVRARISACTVDTTVMDGAAAHAIVATAHNERSPLIAMASHGRTGLARLFLGSVSTRVLQDAGVPVLLVRPALAEVEPKANADAEEEVATTAFAPWLIA